MIELHTQQKCLQFLMSSGYINMQYEKKIVLLFIVVNVWLLSKYNNNNICRQLIHNVIKYIDSAVIISSSTHCCGNIRGNIRSS